MLFSRKFGVRGGPLPDWTHRHTNSVSTSWHECGLSLIKGEFAVVGKVLHGPFKGMANFGCLVEAGRQFTLSEKWDNKLYGNCYFYICFQVRWQASAEVWH